MYFKNMDFLIDLYKNFNEVGIFAVIYIIYALIQILSQNILYKKTKDGKSKNTDNQYNFIHIYNTSSINVLVSNDFYSLSAYPKEEVIKYIPDWDKN